MAMLGFVPDARQEYRLGVVRDHIADDKQPQHQMDAIKTQRIVVNANARLGAQDQSNTINLTARHIELDRTANNYKLRTTAPNSPRVKMEVERSKTDLNADYRIQYGEQRSHIGLQYGRDSHNAERFALTPQGARRNAYRFADIHSDHYHLYYDHYWDLTPEHQISGGLSYDRLTADVKKKNTPSQIGEQNFPAPNQLWQQSTAARLTANARRAALVRRLPTSSTPASDKNTASNSTAASASRKIRSASPRSPDKTAWAGSATPTSNPSATTASP